MTGSKRRSFLLVRQLTDGLGVFRQATPPGEARALERCLLLHHGLDANLGRHYIRTEQARSTSR